MLPKMTSSTSGKPTPQISPTRSRANSFPSVTTSRVSAERGTAMVAGVVADMVIPPR
jgi:hypothetical protein